MRCYKSKSLSPQTGGSKPPPYVEDNGLTLASLCRGRGTTKWWWESFKGIVTFPTDTDAHSAPLRV